MKFKLSPDFTVDTEKSPWVTEGMRIGLWGGSGCGKSSTAALLVEQFLAQGGAVVIFEPRAEYHTLKEKFDVVVCGGPYEKDIDFVASSPASYARAVVDQGVSIVFYTSDVEDETKLIEFTSRFLHYLLKYNETTKRPLMLVTEETEEYAPLSTKGRVSPPWVFSRMIRQFKTAARDARKLNIVTVNLSPRPQEINFTIRQLCNLTLFGKFSPQDANYVDRECLKPLRAKGVTAVSGDLMGLATGAFLAIYGISAKTVSVTEKRVTKHGAETPKLEYVAPRTEETQKAVTDLTETLQKALAKEREELSEVEKERRKAKALEKTVEDQGKEIESLNAALRIASNLKIQPFEEGPDVSALESRVQEAEGKLQKIKVILETSLGVTTPVGAATSSADLLKVWEPKMPSLCAKRIFRFLLVNRGAKYTKSQVGVQLGYKTSSGTFNGAISFLKQNNLIQYDGKFLQCDLEMN